jgi:glyoxylase-like metal-dependent hydrolase (beta-lactamase superfamily II)
MDVAGTAVTVPGRVPTGTTNCYVCGRERPLLVDPPARADAVDDLLADRPPAGVAVTHHHPDHAGGVAAYARAHDATVWCRAGRADAFERATGIAPDRTFRAGTSIPADGPVTVVDAPGHAPEHVVFAAGDALLSGDVAVAEGSVAVAAPEGDVRAYLTTLRRLRARAPSRLLPGHGPPIEDARAACERLLAHRLDRERRVLAAVRDAPGGRSIEEITTAAYETDVSAVRELATATVRAHLEKLAVEGRVAWDGERVVPVVR